MKYIVLLVFVLTLISCGSSPKRVHEKQRTPSDVQISTLDFAKKYIELRFEYRTYIERSLNSIDCDLILNQAPALNMFKETNLELGAFSTEIIVFSLESLSKSLANNARNINYNLQCIATYNKGSEYINKDSVLHLVPASQNKYR